MSEQAKGLPSELDERFGLHVEIEGKEAAAKLLGKIQKAKSADQRNALVGRIKLVDNLKCTTPLTAFVTKYHTQLVSLFKDRQDLLSFIKEDDATYVDAVAFLTGIQDARTKAIKGKTQSLADAGFNYRTDSYKRSQVDFQFSSAFKTVNTTDNLFFNKYFAIKREGSQVRTVLVDRTDHCTMYDIPFVRNNVEVEDIPDSLLSRINEDLALYVTLFDDFLHHTPPQMEELHDDAKNVVFWRDVESKKHTVEEYVDFIDNYLIERVFDDEWCKANNRTPIPHVVLLLHDSVCQVFRNEEYQKEDGSLTTISTPIRYEIAFNKYNGPKSYVYRLFKALSANLYDAYDAPTPYNVVPLSNTDGELCRHYIKPPQRYNTKATNNDELLTESIKLCGTEIEEYLASVWRIRGDSEQNKLSREQLGREMFFVGACIDANGRGSQSLSSADCGGNGKTGCNIDFIGLSLNSITDHTFCTFQDSNIFTQDFSGRSNVFDSILCVIDEYDGRSALDDKSWYKKVSGTNSEDATFSTKELNSKNIDHNISHMKFMFLCNVEAMVLGSDAARRRTLPVVFDGLEGDYDFKENLPKLRKQFPKFLEGCWHYYQNTALRNKSDDYIILTPEEYIKFLGDGVVPYTQTKDAARNAFMNDPRLQNHYTMMDFTNKWANDELYEELFEACFVADEEAVVSARELYTHVAKVYNDNDELSSQALLEFEKGCDDFKRGKGTGWSTFTKWIIKKYPFVNFKYKTNGKNCVKGLKLVNGAVAP